MDISFFVKQSYKAITELLRMSSYINKEKNTCKVQKSEHTKNCLEKP